MTRLDDIFDEHYPLGRVKANAQIDDEKAEVMTKIMEYRRTDFKQQIKSLMLELIGEDETVPYTDMDGVPLGETRNTARDADELRKKVEEL